MSRIIKVSFEVTDNYDVDGFRNFIKFLQSDDKYDLYIISNDDSSVYINSIADNLGFPDNRIVVCNFPADKLQAVIDNNIDIHIDNLQSFVLSVEQDTENAYGVLVTKNLNKFYLEPDYTLVFNRLVKQIEDTVE